jgi:hypothetical protein
MSFTPALPIKTFPFNLGRGSVTIAPSGVAASPPQPVYTKRFDPPETNFLYIIMGAMFFARNFQAPDDFTAYLQLQNAAAGPPLKATVSTLAYLGAATFPTLYGESGQNVDAAFTEAIANLPLSLSFVIASNGALGGTWSWDGISGYMMAVAP